MKTLKLGKHTGSLINHFMSNSITPPVVGEGATVLHWTDRDCYEVIEVSEDLKTVKLERLEAYGNPETKNDIGHENWLLRPTGNFSTLVWWRNRWCSVHNEVSFLESFIKDYEENNNETFYGFKLRKQNPELADKIYGKEPYNHIMPANVVEGVTKSKKKYTPVNIVFGVKDYHYDWTF